MNQPFDRLWEKAAQQRVPLTGAFEILPVCNLSCKMCYVRKDMAEVQAEGGLMPVEFWLDVVKQAHALGLHLPLLTGGEPFLYPDFEKLYAEMHAMGMQVSINSNATLIDEPMAKWLGKHCPSRINVTLYGASEKTYERLCGNADAFNRVRRAVDWLKKYGVPVKFNASITTYNYDDLDDIIAYAKSVGSPVQVATYMFPPVRRNYRMVGENDRMPPEQAARAKVRADYLQQEPKWFLAQADRFRRFVPLTQEMLDAQTAGMPRPIPCRAGRSSFWVDWKGNLGVCGMNSMYTRSLKEHSFADAWEKIIAYVNELRYSPVCTNCPNSPLCHACVSMILNETGGFDGRPTYLCEMHECAARYYQEYVEQYPDLLARE